MRANKELFQLGGKIKILRDQLNMTQTELAKKLGLKRASVNSWEMGLSVPSTPMIVELSKLLNIPTDYLLGMEMNATIRVNGLSDDEVLLLIRIIKRFQGS